MMQPSLWRSGLHTLVTSVVSVALGLLTSILVARSLGPQGKGAYDLVFATSGLLAAILGLSLQSGVVYVVAQGKAALGALALRLAPIALAEGVLAAGVLQMLQRTHYSIALLPAGMGLWAALAVAASLTLSELGGHWRSMLVGCQEIVKANTISVVGRIMLVAALLVGLSILAARHQAASPTAFIWVNIGATGATAAIFLWAVRSWLHDFRGTSGLASVATFALPCYLGNLVQFLNYRLDVFIVSYLLSSEQVGLYTLAVSVAQLVWLIPNAAAAVLLPRVAASQGATAANASRTAQATRLALWVSLATAAALGFAAPVLPLVYGEAFRRSIVPFLWLLPGIVSFAAVSVLASYIAGIGRPQINLLIALVGVAFTVPLDLVLIPRLGIVGAAAASTISYSVSAILSLWFFARQSNTHVRDALLIQATDIKTAVQSLLRAHSAG